MMNLKMCLVWEFKLAWFQDVLKQARPSTFNLISTTFCYLYYCVLYAIPSSAQFDQRNQKTHFRVLLPMECCLSLVMDAVVTRCFTQ